MSCAGKSPTQKGVRRNALCSRFSNGSVQFGSGCRTCSLLTPLRRWHRELVKAKWRFPHPVVSRPRISLEIQVLVWRMSRENHSWGYKRIKGELQKIGIKISTTSIRRILAVKSRPDPHR